MPFVYIKKIELNTQIKNFVLLKLSGKKEILLTLR